MTTTTTREDLFKAIWQTPMSRLAPEFHCSGRWLAKVCVRHKIPVPPRGYWARSQYGYTEWIPPLPLLPGGNNPVITVATIRRPQRDIVAIDRAETNPLSAGPLLANLEWARVNQPKLYQAFFWTIGTLLTAAELAALRWEDVHINASGQWFVRLQDRSRRDLEAEVSPRAVEALQPFQKAAGSILANYAYERTRFAGVGGVAPQKRLPMIAALRAWAETKPVRFLEKE